ncbi:SgcJ/EcaC family oxidoreductase [Streptomyces sp. NBC_00878]|uniref:SgcJ/EcaC family oxidoreductase n=1 Tax=Streptomyces sp. NBC_00878 TaxID=2975854 RepID=UPI00224F581C|nr:SgcJ/EcaC family oxidoreductase [Streptomyces sp. NBC_00878]MCX4904803.1 SgcJ/EcaC family oxidoreductase [Streptomyces sp. NBC_00878]
MTSRRTVLRKSAAVTLGAAALGTFVPAASAEAQTSDAHRQNRLKTQQCAEIVEVLKNYERSLNASDVAGVVRLYTDDAVFLPPQAPTAVGIDAVRATYAGLFQTLRLSLTFEVAEVNVVSPDWAFLRSSSTGTATVLANGTQLPSSNHELFVLHRNHTHWKLARYSFSSVLPSA